MKHYAHAEPRNTIALTLDVYDDHGRAFIRKVVPWRRNPIEWHAHDMTAEAWVAFNSSPRRKWRWEIL